MFISLLLSGCFGGDSNSATSAPPVKPPVVEPPPVEPPVEPPPVGPPPVEPPLVGSMPYTGKLFRVLDEVYQTGDMLASGSAYSGVGGQLYSPEQKVEAKNVYDTLIARFLKEVCSDPENPRNEGYNKCESTMVWTDGLLFAVNTNDADEFEKAVKKMLGDFPTMVTPNSWKEDYKKSSCSVRSTVKGGVLHVNPACLDFPVHFYEYSLDYGKTYTPLTSESMAIEKKAYDANQIQLRLKESVSSYLTGFSGMMDGYLTGAIDLTQQDENYTLHYGTSTGERFDIVFLSDGYLEEDRAIFLKAVETFKKSFLARPSVKKYAHQYSIHSYFTASNERGVDWSTCPKGTDGIGVAAVGCGSMSYADSYKEEYKNARDTYYDTGFWGRGRSPFEGGKARLLTSSKQIVDRVRNQEMPFTDQVIVTINTKIYGGAAENFIATTDNNGMGDTAFHEILHSAVGLYDEYVEGTEQRVIDICLANICNEIIDPETGEQFIPWRHWIVDPNNICTDPYSGGCSTDAQGKEVVGWYEGAYYSPKGYYRSLPTSIMDDSSAEMGPVNEELWLKATYKRVPLFSVVAPQSIGFQPIRNFYNAERKLDREYRVEDQVDLLTNPFYFVNLRGYSYIQPKSEPQQFTIDVLGFDQNLQRIEWFLNDQKQDSAKNQKQLSLTLKSGDEVMVKVSDVSGVADGVRVNDDQRRIFQTFRWIVK